jgi:hypothetical protein
MDVCSYFHDPTLVKEKQKLLSNLRTMPNAIFCVDRSALSTRDPSSGLIPTLQLSDIDPHWYYVRGATDLQISRRISLNPTVVKGMEDLTSKGARGGHGKS